MVPRAFVGSLGPPTPAKKLLPFCHATSQSARIRARGVPRVLRRESYKGLLHRGLYTNFFTTRYVKTLSDNNY
jgi:hypothetical protein